MNAEVKETIQELQECIEVQKKTFTDLQNEYSNYQVVSMCSLKIYTNCFSYAVLHCLKLKFGNSYLWFSDTHIFIYFPQVL